MTYSEMWTKSDATPITDGPTKIQRATPTTVEIPANDQGMGFLATISAAREHITSGQTPRTLCGIAYVDLAISDVRTRPIASICKRCLRAAHAYHAKQIRFLNFQGDTMTIDFKLQIDA